MKRIIATNKGEHKIFMVIGWHANPDGGPAIIDSQISLMPGEKVELTHLGIEIEEEPMTATEVRLPLWAKEEQERMKLKLKRYKPLIEFFDIVKTAASGRDVRIPIELIEKYQKELASGEESSDN